MGKITYMGERELERYMREREREGKITYMGERVGKKNLHTGRREGKESDGRESGSK